MIKCSYCNVTNDKDYGTCNYCGAPLVANIDIDNNTSCYDLSIREIHYAYQQDILTYDEWKRITKKYGIVNLSESLVSLSNKSKERKE